MIIMIYALKILYSLAIICLLGSLIHFFYMAVIKSEHFFYLNSNQNGSFGKKIYKAIIVIGTIVFGYSGAYNLLIWFPISIGGYSTLKYIIAAFFGLLSLSILLVIERYAEHRVLKNIYRERAKELERLVTSDPKRLTLLQEEFQEKINSADEDTTSQIYYPLLQIIAQKLKP
jgi:hypothetical protein